MLSDEEKKAIEVLKDREYDFDELYCTFRQSFIKPYDKSIGIVLELIEKQSKEIEELKQFKKQVEEIESTNFIKYKNYISKEESEQKEKNAYIDGTNIADKLCNKKWEDKIKAILEEYKYTEIGDSEKIIEFYKKMQSLLEKE